MQGGVVSGASAEAHGTMDVLKKMELLVPRRGIGFVQDAVSELTESTMMFKDELHTAMSCKHHVGDERRCCSEALVWTNFLLVVPAYLYLEAGLLLAAGAVVLSLASSALYHFHVEAVHWHLVADKFFAIVAFLGTFPTMMPVLPALSLVVSFLIVCLAFWFKKHQDTNYDRYHSLWHFTIFVGQLFLTLHL